MKVVTYARNGEERLAFVDGDAVVDALAALPVWDNAWRACFTDCVSFIRGGEEALRQAAACVARAPGFGAGTARGNAASSSDASFHHPVQRQQLPRPQRREGGRAHLGQGTGVLRPRLPIA